LHYTKIPKVFFAPHQGNVVNWATKGITNATIVSQAKCYPRPLLQQWDPVILETMWVVLLSQKCGPTLL
jgi:hypothetical protein